MGTVINFPRVHGREKRATTTDASRAVIILPVVRIERAQDVSSCAKSRVAKSVAKSAPGRRRRKRSAQTLPASAFGPR